MNITIFLYDDMTALDAIGPYEVLSRLPGASVTFVGQGKIITAAGVSAGIDMALWLVGEIGGIDLAQAIQLGIEYDLQPPFDTGSPSKANETLIRRALEVVD